MMHEETYTSRMRTYVHFEIYEPQIVLRSRGVVMIHHGVGERASLYYHFANYLLDHGYIVVVSDTVGHGASLIDYEQGYFGENELQVLPDLIGDMHHLQDVMMKRYADLPYFMIGIGFGGWLVRKYASVYGDYIHGFMMLSSPNYLSNQTILEARLNLTKAMKGKLYHPYNAIRDYRISLSRQLGEEPFDYMVHDENMKRSIDEDTITYFTYTVQGYLDLFRIMKEANSVKTDQAIPKTMAIYLLGGEEDPLIHQGKDIIKTYNQMKMQKIEDVNYKLFPHKRHALLFDDNRREVYDCIISWLNEHTYL